MLDCVDAHARLGHHDSVRAQSEGSTRTARTYRPAWLHRFDRGVSSGGTGRALVGLHLNACSP